MEIVKIKHDELLQSSDQLAACIGYFDGIHLGHQKLIEKCVQIAHEMNYKSTLITFDPDPWVVVNGAKNLQHITPMKHRLSLIEQMGIERVILLEFNDSFGQLSIEEFHDVLVRLGVKALVCGFDYRYAHKGSGSVNTLKEANIFPVFEIPKINVNGNKVSSSTIEEDIASGHMHLVAQYLGRAFSIQGIVIHGKKLGRTLGFPTANLDVNKEYVHPKIGVYVTSVYFDNEYHQAITSIGYNPTVDADSDVIKVESYLLDFDGDLYGKDIEVFFLKHIRDEMKFNDLSSLIEQMESDELETIAYFKS